MLQKAAEHRLQLLRTSTGDIEKAKVCGGFLTVVGTSKLELFFFVLKKCRIITGLGWINEKFQTK